MPTPLDYALEVAPESTYGTAGTTWRGLDLTSDSLQLKKETKSSAALRVGRMAAASRGVVWSEGSGATEFEAETRGMGIVYQAMVGAGVSTLVAAGTYQQNFTLSSTPPSSLTFRKSVPQANGTTWGQYTFTGAMCTGFEISFGNKDLVTLSADWLSKAPTAGTAASLTPAYAVQGPRLTFAQASISTGTLTAPTTTALATAVTPLCIRSGTIKVDHAYSPRTGTCTNGQPGKGGSADLRKVTGSFVMEYDSNTYTDLMLNDGTMSFVGTWQSSGVDAMQVVLPDIRLDGDLPVPAKGDLITHTVNFEAMHSAAQLLWLIVRTTDIAL